MPVSSADGTKDPSGMAAVSLTNPQSWNMYAYVTNNPTNLIDALGLDGGAIYVPAIPATCNAPGQYQTICENDTSGTYVDAMAAAANQSSCMAGEYGCSGTPSENAVAENNYVNDNCLTCITVGGVTYSSIAQWADTVTSEAAWQSDLNRARNGATSAFDALYKNEGFTDPNATYKVSATERGFAVEDTLDGIPLDVANAEANGIYDMFSTIFHPGASWYETSFLGLFGTDVPHLIDGPNGAMGHIDPGGPLNPIHLGQVVTGLIGGTTQWGTFTCSYANGCS